MRPSLHTLRLFARAATLACGALVLVAGACRTAPRSATPASTATVAPAATVASAPASAPAAPAVPAGELRDASFWSPSLGATKRYRVWLPPGYARDGATRYPVAFYLHGLYGDETNWTRQGALGATLDSMTAAGLPPMIVVTPDGDDGWYVTWNALVDAGACRRAERTEAAEQYCVPWGRYDEYVARDLVRHVDTTYRTRATRDARAIAGLSMGGYGAVTLAMRYPDVFAAAASHSGVLSPLYDGGTPFTAPPRYAATIERVRERWLRRWPLISPAFGRDTAAWWARDPARLARQARTSGAPLPALWFDAGTEDAGIIDQNHAFAWELTQLGIPHEWTPRPGRHDWAYWRGNAPHSLAWIGGRIGGR